jgi:uncharacterized UPF0160 family protein
MSKIMMTSIQNWSKVYNNAELGKQIGMQVLGKLREDGFAYTHDGVYHADDIFCMALIEYALGYFKFIRTRDLEHSYFTFDVGGGDFDHHQCDEYRDGEKKGIFASFGKLWCTVGRTLGLREEVWKEIDELFVQPIDLTDNTGVMNPVNYMINSTKRHGLGEGFIVARSMAEEILIEIIESGLQKSKQLDDFYKEVERSGSSPVLELSRHYVVNKEVYQSMGIDWIIFPDVIRGLFTVQAVGKKLLPEDLRGKSNEGDIVFTHKGGWVGKTQSIESARALVAIVL